MQQNVPFDQNLMRAPSSVHLGKLRASAAEPNAHMPFRIFCLFMIAKPLIDITWSYGFSVGGLRLSLLSVSGGMVAVIGVALVVAGRVKTNAIAQLFYLFLACFILSYFLDASQLARSKSMVVLDQFLRLMSNVAVLLFGIAFSLRRSFNDLVTLVQCIWLGINAALFVNMVAIALGLESYGISDGMDRNNGLYHDAGVLAIIAVQNLCVCMYLPSLQLRSRRKIPTWMIYGSLLVAIVFMGASVSRAAIALAACSMVVYLLMFLRSAVSVQAACILLLGVGGLCYIFLENAISQRFTPEIVALREGVSHDITFQHGSIDLGDFQRFGSNRGKIIEGGLNEFIRSRPADQLLGRFTFRTTHCDYVDILGRFGIVGLSVYLILLLSSLRALVLISRQVRTVPVRALVSLATSFLVMYIFYSIPFRPLWYTTNSWYVWLLLGMVVGTNKQSTKRV